MWYHVDRGQQKNSEIAEESKLKELSYLFAYPLAGNFKMEASLRMTVSESYVVQRNVCSLYSRQGI